MNKKETAVLRRFLTGDRNGISALKGCYVSQRKEIISCFDCSLVLMPEEEAEKYLSILRRVLSGKEGSNSFTVDFSVADVTGSEKHALLSRLRKTRLEDEEALKDFYTAVIGSLKALENDCLILIACNTADVKTRHADGRESEDSETSFTHLISCVCPVRDTKPGLGYSTGDGSFHTCPVERVASAPDMGFVFPAFDDYAANIYGALYYCRDTGDTHPDYISAVFGKDAPTPADEQRGMFSSLLTDTIGDACSYDVVQGVRDQIAEMVENHKADKENPEPLTVSKIKMEAVLESSGVEAEKVAGFGVRFDEAFGEGTELPPENLIDIKKLEITTPSVVIRADADRGDLIRTRVIDGVKYILIRADESVELNGLPLTIEEP